MSQIAPSLENTELVAFVAIVDAGSFTQAARELRVPRATLGRRLARLEERLDARLLLRTTRSVTLTEVGEGFYRHARQVLEAVERAEASVRHDSNELSGTLRVSLPPMTDPALFDLILGFAEEHPAVDMQVHFGTRHVDLIRDGYDVAIRAGTVHEQGLISRRLMEVRMLVVGSPAYLAEHGSPQSVDDLADHRCLSSFERGEVPRRTWQGPERDHAVDGVFFTNLMPLLLDAAIRGLGLAQVPEPMATGALADGRLVQVLDELTVEGNVSVVYPERKLLPRQVRAFVDAIVEWKLPVSG
jgi:DNA-binding transcriptional LysR family regulator